MSWATPKRLGIILTLSLVINIFLIGFLVGSFGHKGPFMRHGKGGDIAMKSMMSPRGLHGILRNLPREDRAKVRELIGNPRDVLREPMEQMRTAGQEVQRAMAAPKFSPDDLSTAFAGMRQAHGDMQVKLHQSIEKIAASLSVEQRKKLFQHRGGKMVRPPPPE